MKFIEQIDGEPRMLWYRAVALLIPIGVVVVGSTFAMLLLCYGSSQPLPPEARIPVTAAFTISAMVSFFLWRWALRSLLSPAGIRDKQYEQQPTEHSVMKVAAMKSKHWLLTGFGCIAASVLTGVALMFSWINRVRSFGAGDSETVESIGTADPFHAFGSLMVGAAVGSLLFFGGIIMVIVGFISLAKETKPKPETPA